MNSETYHYKRGAGQSFNQPSHTVDPSRFPDEEVCMPRVTIEQNTAGVKDKANKMYAVSDFGEPL